MHAIEFRVIVLDDDGTSAILGRNYRRSTIPVIGRKAPFVGHAFPEGKVWLTVTSTTSKPPRVFVRAEGHTIETFLAAGWKRIGEETPGP